MDIISIELMFMNVRENNTSIFTVFSYPWLNSFVVATENPECQTKCSWSWNTWIIFSGFSPNHRYLVTYYLPDEYVSPLNYKLMGGFFLLHDLIWLGPRERNQRIHLLLCRFWTGTKYRHSVLTGNIHQWADGCHSRALLVRPGSHHHKTWMPWSTSLWFCQQIYQTHQNLSEHGNPTRQKLALVLSCPTQKSSSA